MSTAVRAARPETAVDIILAAYASDERVTLIEVEDVRRGEISEANSGDDIESRSD